MGDTAVGLDVEVTGMHDCFGFFKAFFGVDAVTSHLIAIKLVVQFRSLFLNPVRYDTRPCFHMGTDYIFTPGCVHARGWVISVSGRLSLHLAKRLVVER